MGSIYWLLVLVFCMVECNDAAGNESNILRLSKPRSISSSSSTPTKLEVMGSNGTGKATDTSGQRPVVEFSKNNPELDWKTHLRKVAEQEEKTRSKEFDLDFMRDRLETSANSIQWLVDLYDPLRWTKIPGDVGNECRRDMTTFLNNLKRGELWAAKRESIFTFDVCSARIIGIALRRVDLG